MGNKMLATRFLKTEEEARQQWVRLLASDEHVPVDVAFKATCEITREYYPIAEYAMTCVGSWSAMSVKEHEEEYQVAREETVYIDKDGKAHSHPANDRWARTRTVWDTKTKMVIDRMWDTYGDIGPLKLVERVAISDVPDMEWLNHFEKGQFVKVEDGFFDDCVLMPSTVSDAQVDEQAESDAISDVANYGKHDVPGDRFEDYSLNAFSVEESVRTDKYLGVYHVVYQYDGETYECYLSGGTNSQDYLFGPLPVDESIKGHADLLEEKVSESGCFTQAVALAAAVLLIFIGGLSMLFTGPRFDYVQIFWGIALVVGIYLAAWVVLTHMLNSKLKKEKAQFSSDNAFLRERILELSENDAMSAEEKQRTVETWLSEHAEGKASGQGFVEREIAGYKKKKRIIGLVAIGAAIVSVVINVMAGPVGGW